jgi:hypothetical protein
LRQIQPGSRKLATSRPCLTRPSISKCGPFNDNGPSDDGAPFA